ncbi:unnamed protein product [Symbiodinium necroappetens]|uniref:Uncharacterized protein n=1 Tax=Symbiodinium necroappetens TaxID=1628268 RepID=A0A812R356_9DINO|nr:unnamed protein product [Symbiodinium necroappetens]CAE7772661.1 unnamed protein product [Symbiodinium sp. KB8]
MMTRPLLCHKSPLRVQSGLFSTEVRKQVAPMVKFHQNAYCPECGKHVTHGDVEKMREACSRMWRKFMRLDDSHCPLFRICDVKIREGEVTRLGLWERMPRIKGRS